MQYWWLFHNYWFDNILTRYRWLSIFRHDGKFPDWVSVSVSLSYSFCTPLVVIMQYWWLLHNIGGYCTILWLLLYIGGYCTILVVIAQYGWLLCNTDGYCVILVVIAQYWWLLHNIGGHCKYWWLLSIGQIWDLGDFPWFLLVVGIRQPLSGSCKSHHNKILPDNLGLLS